MELSRNFLSTNLTKSLLLSTRFASNPLRGVRGLTISLTAIYTNSLLLVAYAPDERGSQTITWILHYTG